MFGRPNRQSKWSYKYPPGAIQTREALRDIIIEARKEKKAIRLYGVEQMGHLSVLYLTSKSQLSKPESAVGACSGDAFYSVQVIKDHANLGYTDLKRRFFKDRILCGSYSVGCMSNEHHRLFQNRMLAEQYAAELKNDPEYVQGVKEHWAWCDRMFSEIR